MLNFFDPYSVDEQHQLSLDDVFRGADPFGILDDCIALAVAVDEIGDVAAVVLEEVSLGIPLDGYQDEGYLFAEVGDQPSRSLAFRERARLCSLSES